MESAARMKNKQIMLIDYKMIHDIDLAVYDISNNNSVIVDQITLHLNNGKSVELDCAVTLTRNLFEKFRENTFNALMPSKREEVFRQLIEVVNKGYQ